MESSTIGLLTATSAYILLAFSAMGDKFLVSKTFRNPYSYAIIIAFASLGLFLFSPAGVLPVSAAEWAAVLVAGSFSTIALVLYYTALQESDASSLLPVVGAVSIFLTGLFAFFFIDERLRPNQILAVVLMAAGLIILTYGKKLLSRRAIAFGLASALIWAISNVAMKIVFSALPFFAGLAYSRLGAAAAAGFLLASPSVRNEFKVKTHFATKTLLFIGFNAAIGAGGELLKYFSISLLSPTVVNAMQGLLYGILFILGLTITRVRPKLLSERADYRTVARKSVGIAFVIAGLAALALL